MGLGRIALLGLAIVLATSVPFVPTGELVSAAASYASGSWLDVALIFVVVCAASIAGDSVMLLGVSATANRVTPKQRAWLSARKLAPAVRTARKRIATHAPQAIVTGRLVPGGRAPVIIALGIARYPVRRFAAADTIACAAWTAIYVTLGAASGRLTGHPLWGIAVAVVCAVVLGWVVSRVAGARERRHAGHEPAPWHS